MPIRRRFVNLLVGTDVKYDLTCVNNGEACTDATSHEVLALATNIASSTYCILPELRAEEEVAQFVMQASGDGRT